MSRRPTKVFKSFGYTARPRRARTKDGVEEWYWTVRCRREGEAGEWSLGWHATVTKAEYAFHDWVQAHRNRPRPDDGSAKLLSVIDDYIEMVPTMAARPNTKNNRIFRAKKLGAFVEQVDAEMTVGEFNDRQFADYMRFLLNERGHTPQTTENALIGARTLLRWAQAQGLVEAPPKPPSIRVPAPQHAPLYEEDMEATIAHAEAPLDTMLALMWETGLRVSEAATTRTCDLMPDDRLVVVCQRDGFMPKSPDSSRRVPVTPELMEKLVALTSGPDAPLFPVTVRCAYHYWRHRLRQAQKAAGVRNFTFHDIRRAVADRLRRGNVPLDGYAKLMGHAPVTAVRHYSTVTAEDLHEALEAGLRTARRRDTGAEQ